MMARIVLNGKEVEAEVGSNLLLAAMVHGVYIPHFCFHPALTTPAHCRLCLTQVEVEGEKALTTACNAAVVDGMVVDTETEAVAKAREDVLEFTLVNHALDCPVCVRAGECELQDYTHSYGRDHSRFDEEKVVRGKKELGTHVQLYADRCIHCSRCVRFCDEVAGTGELDVFQRGAHTAVDVHPDRRLDNRMSGNVIDICPVGALADKDVGARPPVWTLTGVDSICPGCSAGCNVRIDVGAGQVQRLKPRVNLEVNQYWMCDDGRYGWSYVDDAQRLPFPLVEQGGRQVPVSWDEALAVAHNGLDRIRRINGGGAIAVFFIAHLTNEEDYLLARLAKEMWGTDQVGMRLTKDVQGDVRFASGFTIRAEKAPNGHGVRALAAGLHMTLLEEEEIWQAMEVGQIRGAFILGGNPQEQLSEREKQALGKLDFLVVQDMMHSELTRRAQVVLSGATFVEKDGTFANEAGRVQLVRQAVALRERALPDWQILQRLAAVAGRDWHWEHPALLLEEMAGEVGGIFAGLSYAVLQEREPDQPRGGFPYGGGWAMRVQRSGFLNIEDHTK